MVNVPGSIITRGIPEIPEAIALSLHPYSQVRSAGFVAWDTHGEGLLVTTRFGETFQLHYVNGPGRARKQLTFFDEPVYLATFSPARDSHGFLFSMDTGGGEAYQIYYFDMGTGKYRMLTDGRAQNINPAWSHQGHRIAYSSTVRNGRDYDIWVTDTNGREASLLWECHGYWGPAEWSPDDRYLLLQHYVSATESYYHILDTHHLRLEPVFQETEPVAYGDAKWSRDGQGIFYTSDKGSQFLHLHYRDLNTGEDSALTGHIPWNVEGFDLSSDGCYLAYVTNEDGISRLRALDLRDNTLVPVPALPEGIVAAIGFKPGRVLLAVSLSTAQYPSDVYSLEIGHKDWVRWTESEVGGLTPHKFPSQRLIRYPSFDEREIPAFFYTPSVHFSPPYPVVIYIHGGPESQFRPRFTALFQHWLNELGIAVLAPNVRGSIGYGKDYIKLDNGYLREDSVKDIGALLDWIAQQPELDASRVCVYGASYGGYMVLASLIHYGDRLRAGVDIVGISNFVTFLHNTKDYRRDLRRVEYGDERDPRMAAFLESISPTHNAHRLQRPLLVGQGLNDPRVPASEAEQIVEAVARNGQAIWYVLGQDEGHGFQKKPNVDYFNQVVALFLQQYLL